VPSFGDWGFMLATVGGPPPVRLPPGAPPTRFLDGPLLRAATVFPRDRGRLAVRPSTLLNPTILEYARTEWRGY